MLLNSRKKQRLIIIIVSALILTLLSVFNVNRNERAEASDTSFRFVVLGDSRGSSNGVNETTLRTLMTKVQGLSIQPEFILFTGDQVNGGTDVANELTAWKSIMDDYYPLTQIYPALGNHEHDETIFSNAFTHLPSGQLSGYQSSAYYFDYGNTRIITLNSDRKDADGKYIIGSAQRAWLKDVLRNNGKTHNIVQFHVPAYPIGPHYGTSLDGNPVDRDKLWDILDGNQVTAVLVGHEHNYNRRLIDSSLNGTRNYAHGIYQVTIGGAGAPLTSTNLDSTNVVVGPVASYHYTVVDIADGTATFTTYDINDNLIDSFTVNRSNPIVAPTVQFEAANMADYYIRHINARARMDASGSIANQQDMDWRKVPGLADASGISFESINFPGDFLRHRNGEVWKDDYDGSTLFREDATFYERSGLTDSSLLSFESYNFPGRYIRHRSYLLYNEAVSGSVGLSDATFRQY